MIQISNSSIIISETYNYRDHREDSTRTKPTELLNTLAAITISIRQNIILRNNMLEPILS